MLLSKTVPMKWNPRNKKYFVSLSYPYTKIGDEFKVKVEDLLDGSGIKVNVRCDNCGKIIYNVKWYSYKRYISQDGKYYCKKCAINLYGKKNRELTQLKNSSSFAQWGIDNIGEDFLEKYWDFEKNKISPWEISYGSNKKIWIKCQKKDYHGSYDVSPNSFTNMNSRCPYCYNYINKLHKLDSLGYLYPQVLKIWSDKNRKSSYEYAPKSNKRVWWKCLEGKHKDYKRGIDISTKLNFRCPECTKERDESLLQEKVRLYLNELDYTILNEHNCTLKCINPKTKHLLPYDNETIINNQYLIIEVHGSQHYKISNFHKRTAKRKTTTPEYEFHMLKVRDRYKRIYAKSQGYSYLEIPYWTDDAKETWKQLINDKIKELIKESKSA